MKPGFPNSIEPKPMKDKSSPWNFSAPEYDKRSSNFMNAGTHYGVGKNQPVCHEGNPKQRVPCMPFDHKKGMQVDEKG